MAKSKYNTETLIEASKKCHNSEFDNLSYEKTKYESYNTKVTITCHNKDEKGNEHGDFQISITHLLSGQGCPKCRYLKSAKSKRRSLDEVIVEANKVHDNLYDYSLVNDYKNDRIKYPIICKKHGVFHQTFNNHIKFKQGCPICGREKCDNERKLSFGEFLERANKRHSNFYIYHDDEIFRNRKKDTKLRITCPIHGDFEQTLANHLYGQGCPICKTSKLEQEVTSFLIEKNIQFEHQKKFDWLENKRLDFYLPKYNIAIECQGSQHFIEDHFYEPLEITQERDKIKKQLCEENDVKLLYYSNLGIKYPYEVFEDKEKLLEEILKSEDFSISVQKTENA
jgi:very-short-patch-repair endonuclease